MKYNFPNFKNFYIREFQDGDRDLIFKLRSNSEVQKYYPEGIFDYQKASNYYDVLKNHYKNHGFSYMPIFEKNTDKFIGICGLIFFDSEKENFKEGKVEIGYAIMPDFWGQGIATDLSMGFVKWGFENLPINKIIAVCNPDNIPSLKVIKKIGGKFVKKTTNPRIGDVVEMYEITSSKL